MDKIVALRSTDQIKLLADSRRREILRMLMAAPATLTQLGLAFHQSPARIRHHILRLQSVGLVEIVEVRTTGKVTEKYYGAKAGAFLLSEFILPRSQKNAVIFSGSNDLAFEGIAERLQKRVTLLNLSVGSIDGLMYLRQGLCQITGVHLLDHSGEYNTPYVRHFFPDREMEIITLANRVQGLMVRSGNPAAIKDVSDLARSDLRFVNRNAGSGTRLWLDSQLKKSGIPPGAIRGYTRIVHTHAEAAFLVAAGKADAALGIQAAAHQSGLDFVPLTEERYDLVMPKSEEKNLAPVLDYLQTRDFREQLGSLTGYSSTHSGEQIPL